MSRLQLFLYNLYSLFVCLRLFRLRVALRRPLLLHPSVRLRGVRRGSIEIGSGARLILGMPSSEGRSVARTELYMERGSRLVISGLVTMAAGTRVIVRKDATMEMEGGFFCNGDCIFESYDSILFGPDALMGWNVSITTSDGHDVFPLGGERKPQKAPVTIGRHVWVASNTIIGKGVTISDDCVVAQGSLVTKQFTEPHCLIGGVPAKILKTGIAWEG